jgi:hypothetical protein
MTPIFYQCTVLNNEDPLMLGRIRAKINIINYPDVLASVTSPKWNEERDIWTERDPLVFYPLLPYFIYQVPKVGELIQVIFVNPEFKYQNQYYVQSNFFSVTSAFNTNNSGGAKFTGTGMQFKAPKNIKNQNGTWPAKSLLKGVFPEPGDNALLGRGSADVVVKEDSVLVRAGKYEQTPQSNLNTPPNNNRSFLQLSIFDKTKVSESTRQQITSSPITLQVKHLIEWVILNPENSVDRFTGSVFLYSLKSSTQTNTNNIQVSTEIPESNKFLIYKEDFQALTFQQAVDLINSFIKTCNDKNVAKNGRTLFSDSQNKFPIFFRPAKFNYELLADSSPATPIQQTIKDNLNLFNNRIKLNPADETATSDSQFGLIWKKDTVGLPIQSEIVNILVPKYEPKPKTYSILGGQEIYLLSQDSAIPNKGQINFADSIYGIPLSAITDEIKSKTSSSVRGEELLDLLNLIVRFLLTHTHAYPGLPPIEVTEDGTTSESILTEMQNAVNKILNSNIRLN